MLLHREIASSLLALSLLAGASAIDVIRVYQPFVNPVPLPNETWWAWNTAAAEFNQTYAGKWGVEILTGSYGDIAKWAATGDPNRGFQIPDVIVTGGQLDDLKAAKTIIPLTSYLDDWATWRPDGDITKDIARASTFPFFLDDEWWGLPVNLDLRPFMYRVDLYQKYLGKTTPPQSWDELVANSLTIQALAKQQDNKDYYGFVVPYNSTDWAVLQWFSPVWLSWGASVATSKCECAINSPAFRGAVKFWTDLWLDESRRIAPYTGNMTYGDYMNMFGDGKVIHWNDGSWGKAFWGNGWLTKLYPCNYDFSAPSATNFSTDRFHIAMMKNPRGPRLRASFMGGSAVAIPSRSTNKDAAMAFIRIFVDPAKFHMQKWVKDGGDVASYMSLQSTQDTRDPALSAKLCQAPYSYPETYPRGFSEYPQLYDQGILPNVLQQVITKNLTVEAATDEACVRMNAIMYPTPEPIAIRSPVGLAIMIITAVLQATCIALVGVLWYLRDQPAIKAIDFNMSATVLIGCAVFLFNTYTYMGPLNLPGCRSSVFLLTLGSGLTLGPCLAKLYRIWTVFESVGIVKANLGPLAMFGIVGGITGIEVALAIIWTAVDPPVFVKTTLPSGARTQICRSANENIDSGFFWAIIAYNVILVLAGLGLAWLSRNAYDRFNESREIGIGFVNVLFLGLVWVLMSIATLTPDFQFWIRAAFQMSMVLALLATLYLPRILKALSSKNGGKDPDFDFSHSRKGQTSQGGSSSTIAFKKQQLEKVKTTELLRAECSVLRTSVLGLKRWSTRKINYLPTLGVIVMDPDSKRGYLGEIYRAGEGTQIIKVKSSSGKEEDNPTYCLTVPASGAQKRTQIFLQFSQPMQASEWESWLIARGVPGAGIAGATSGVFDGNGMRAAKSGALVDESVLGVQEGTSPAMSASAIVPK
ncbi:periplasmic binding protein-like II [Gonapodya prolifera JEL478]|uniref:Periplasmic binding protein-like II n=1 Tax=Gonapodya prolifera (strain JEL478) TaxID=1344416 RepID=A0A139AKH6_GONPJ|nr:periplasmic binding protein-like II [Gonapodya prolifera JEL478]|eukprot:KXS17270.1 periplasmic binding protein-like II [Gonapodya prolifera JEL478]